MWGYCLCLESLERGPKSAEANAPNEEVFLILGSPHDDVDLRHGEMEVVRHGRRAPI